MNWTSNTVVGSKWGFAGLSVMYAIGCIVDMTNSLILFLPVLLVCHFLLVLILALAAPISFKTSMLRFMNEAALAVIVGWVLLLGYVFTFGLFGEDSEKSFGMAFGAGVGLVVVCGPCAVVSSICSATLEKENKRVEPK